MTHIPSKLVFLCVLLLSLALGSIAESDGELGTGTTSSTIPFVVDIAGGQYEVPAIANAEYGATYTCMVYDLKEIRKFGPSWIYRVDARVDETILHHAVGYAIPFGSDLNLPGRYLYGKKSGDTIENCYFPTSSSPIPHVPYAWQHGNPVFDLLDLYDDDNAPETGYPYGIPIGAQTNYEFLIIQGHFHNPEHKVGLKTNPKFFFRATTKAPEENAGVMVGGVFPHSLLRIPAGAVDYKVSALMSPSTPDYESCFPPGSSLETLHAGAAEQIVYVANEGRDTYIKILISGLHAHASQTMLRSWQVLPDGTKVLIDKCHHCGHHGSNNFHVLETPHRINAGDGFMVECNYSNPSEDDAILGGFNTRDEMCRSWNLIAPVPDYGATLFFVDECNVCLGGLVGDTTCVDPLPASLRNYLCSPKSCPP